MINKSKLTKHVWFQDKKWKVEQVISPTKFDDYLLISRKRKEEIHEDSKTTPVDMYLIDVHNEEFYPNTQEVIDLIRRKGFIKLEVQELEDQLSQEWLKALDD